MGIVENVKEIADIVKKIDDVELYRRIVELESEVIELTREKRELEALVEELRTRLEFSEKMTFRAPFWYAENDDVPYCPRCWEADHKAIHLIGPVEVMAGKRYDCPGCNQRFIPERKPTPRTRRTLRG